MSNTRPLVTGLFPDCNSAKLANTTAEARSYTANDMNLEMFDETRKTHFTGAPAGKETELGSKAAEGAGIGGAIGGTIGAIAAAVAAVGTTIALPGLGLVIAGPIAAAITGAGAGAYGGGLIGALIGWNMPEERVGEYEEGMKNGGILMGLRTKDHADEKHLESAWKSHRGQHAYR